MKEILGVRELTGDLSDLPPIGYTYLKGALKENKPEKVYMLYKVFGDGDDYPQLNPISIHRSLDRAKKAAERYELSVAVWDLKELAHEDMTFKNGFTYVGDAKDLGMVSGFGGFLITETELK